MQLVRSVSAHDPRLFGRGRIYDLSAEPADTGARLSDDVRLFAVTFLAGFAFVSILIS
jgi:hypothetical protein